MTSRKDNEDPGANQGDLWPDPVPVPGQPDTVERSWSLVLRGDANPEALRTALETFLRRGDARIGEHHGRVLVLAIRSAHPASADPLETMVSTTAILRAVDAAFGIEVLHGRPAGASLLLRQS